MGAAFSLPAFQRRDILHDATAARLACGLQRAAHDMPGAPSYRSVSLNVNGFDHHLQIEPRHTLLDTLRHDLQLTGTKKVCDMGDCGACTVLVDDAAIYSCLTLAIDCDGRRITTIEGLANGAQLDPIQQAFIDHDAFQCGFCTPGQIMSIKGLLNAEPAPSVDDVRRAVSGNLCRCGAYMHIVEAGLAAAREPRP